MWELGGEIGTGWLFLASIVVISVSLLAIFWVELWDTFDAWYRRRRIRGAKMQGRRRP